MKMHFFAIFHAQQITESYQLNFEFKKNEHASNKIRLFAYFWLGFIVKTETAEKQWELKWTLEWTFKLI